VASRVGGRLFFEDDARYRGVGRWRGDGSKFRRIRRHATAGIIEVTDSYGEVTLLFVDDQGHRIRRIAPIGRVREDVYDQAGGIVFSSLGIKGPPCVTTWN